MQVEILSWTRVDALACTHARARARVCVCKRAPGASRLRKTLYRDSYREADPLSRRVPTLPARRARVETCRVCLPQYFADNKL